MSTSRSFPHALATAALIALIGLAAASSAGAALNPVWLPNAIVGDSGAETFWPRAASAQGRTVVVWKQSDGSTMRLYASTRSLAGAWSTPEAISTAGENLDFENYRVVADAEGDITVYWKENGSGYPSYTRTLPAGSADWQAPQTLTVNTAAGTVEFAARYDGSLVAFYTSYHSQDTIRLHTMRPGASTWDAPVDIDQTGDGPASPSVVYNAAGDGLAVWCVHPGSDYGLRASRYDAASDTWSAPVDVTPLSATSIEAAFGALSPNGAATVVWGSSSESLGKNATAEAGTNDWVAQGPLVGSGQSLVTGGFASDRSGDIVAAYQTWDGSNMSSSRAWTRTRDAATGAWSAPELLMSNQFGGAVSLSVDRNYNLVASMMTSADFSTVNVAAVYRPDGENSFTDDDLIGTFDQLEFSHGIPVSTIDDRGNPIVVWPKHGSGGEVRFNVALGDATGPELRSLTVPSSGTVGDALTFSVDPFDALSGEDVTSWDFSSGQDLTGNTVTRTFDAPGAYTVTVTSRDLSGHSSSATRTITIAPQPVDDTPDTTPTPPKVLPPVLEARLAGKVITLTARVTMRSGKKCAGKATATTSFGSTTYRTTLKLGLVDGKCVGTGTIKLKKAPSTRTRLRVTVSSKAIKTRTLSTRRG